MEGEIHPRADGIRGPGAKAVLIIPPKMLLAALTEKSLSYKLWFTTIEPDGVTVQIALEIMLVALKPAQ